MSFEVTRVLHRKRTKHHDLVLFQNPFFGKMLMLDGATQITKGDEFIYQEMMSHVPLMGHGSAKDVLIIGGGDCGIAKEVLKHPSVHRVVQVEIDASVVEFSREHFPEFTEPTFADSRFESVIQDGMTYAAETAETFDVIIVDSTDPQGPGEVLFSRAFYAACRRCLKKRGILVTQNGVPFFQPGELMSSLRHFGDIFSSSGCYIASIPTYIGGHMTMGWASGGVNLPAVPLETLRRRYVAAGAFATKYWTPAVQQAAFALPRFIEEISEQAKA